LFEYKQTYNKKSDADEDLMLETKEGRHVLVVCGVDRDNKWRKNKATLLDRPSKGYKDRLTIHQSPCQF
jgi:hypothetical protein